MDLSGVGGFVILVVDLYVILMTARRAGKAQAWIWGGLVLFLSLTGVAVWYLAGPAV
ncbi:hypothetical protein [Endothiovibrio diazotrophicus]